MMELKQENQDQDVVPVVPEPESLDANEEDDDLFASIDAAANAAEGQDVQQSMSVEDVAEMQLYLNLPRL